MNNSLRFLLILTILLWQPIAAPAKILKKDTNIETVTKAMKDAGYKETGLAMGTMNPENRLIFWNVDEGVLIATYSTKTHKVLNLSYWFSDERPKALRKNFEFPVVSFDTSSGMMSINTKKTPSGEQDSGGNG